MKFEVFLQFIHSNLLKDKTDEVLLASPVSEIFYLSLSPHTCAIFVVSSRIVVSLSITHFQMRISSKLLNWKLQNSFRGLHRFLNDPNSFLQLLYNLRSSEKVMQTVQMTMTQPQNQ